MRFINIVTIVHDASLQPLTLKKLPLHISRLVTIIVALQILNMGLFAQDFQQLSTSSVCPEINIINTVDEFVAEIILDHKDAVPETNDHSKKDLQLHKHVTNKLINFSVALSNSTSGFFTDSKSFIFSDDYNYQFSEDINPPPPKSLS